MTAAATRWVAQVTTNQVKGVMNDSLALWYRAKLDVSLFHDVSWYLWCCSRSGFPGLLRGVYKDLLAKRKEPQQLTPFMPSSSSSMPAPWWKKGLDVRCIIYFTVLLQCDVPQYTWISIGMYSTVPLICEIAEMAGMEDVSVQKLVPVAHELTKTRVTR